MNYCVERAKLLRFAVMPLPPLLQRRLMLVTGKGGVGKSTVAALLAQLTAEEGHRTLVCELNTRSRIPSFFDKPPATGELQQIDTNLWVVNIDPPMAMEEYALMKLRFRALYRVVFDNPVVESLIRFIPGVNDLIMLGKAFNHERERNADGTPTWDRIIIDAPATGHGITFFRLPRIIRDAVPTGNLHREAADMWSLLTDPERTSVHLVTLPEELPVRETTELHDTLKNELGLPLGHLFVNRLPPPLLGPAQRAVFDTLTPPQDPELRRLWNTTRIRVGREALAAHHLVALDALDMDRVDLPLLYDGPFGPHSLKTLVDRYREQAC